MWCSEGADGILLQREQKKWKKRGGRRRVLGGEIARGRPEGGEVGDPGGLIMAASSPRPGVQWLPMAQWREKGIHCYLLQVGWDGPKCQWQGEQGYGWPPCSASWRRASKGVGITDHPPSLSHRWRGQAIRRKTGVAIGTPLDGKTGSAGRSRWAYARDSEERIGPG